MSYIIEKVETGSTQDDARRLAESGANHMTVVWAHRQTAGRGRYNRQWISKEGNVLWSIVLRPSKNWPTFSDIVYVNALAVHRTVNDAIGNDQNLKLKWPNDLLLNDKKIAGSLLESGGAWVDGRPGWIVIGTGINVVEHPEGADMRYPPTSLFHEGYDRVSREHLITSLASNLEYFIDRWIENSFEYIRTEYLRHAHNLEKEIRVGLISDKAAYVDGTYRGIDARGHLLLEKADQTTQTFSAAEVILKTP